MYDRIPTPGQEGRMLISPEGGTPYYATVAMADNPTQEGTLINKATLLKDATAALFGLGTAAVPDDVHNWVGQYATHWWSVLHGQASIGYAEVRTNIDASVEFTSWNTAHTFTYSKTIDIDQTNGTVTLASPSTITTKSISTGTSLSIDKAIAEMNKVVSLAPVYIKNLYGDPDTIYYLPAGSTVGKNSSKATVEVDYDDEYGWWVHLKNGANVEGQKITSQIYNIPAGSTTYVNSTDRNAYPDDATEGNLTYRYLGVPFDNAVKASRIETGTYVGTGLYGAENPNSLSFDFEPRVLIITGHALRAVNGHGTQTVIFQKPLTSYVYGEDNDYGGTITEWGTTVSWWASYASYSHQSYGQYNQLNGADYNYNYIAIG